MDNLTHSAVALFLSRAGLGRGVRQDTWILLLAANAPDIDVASAAGGALAYLHYHRHLTHSIPLLPVMALLPLLIVRLVSRQPLRWGRSYAISLAGVASHLALDWTNIYGIRLWLPFRDRWFQGDLTSVVDLWIWAACLVALAGPFLSRLVAGEIGARAPKVHGRGFAVAALAFIALWNGGHAFLHARAVAILDSRLYDGAAPLRVAAFPGPANPLRWRGLVETPESYNEYSIDLLGEFDADSGRRYYKPAPDAAIAAAAHTPALREFLRFSQFPYWQVLPGGEAGSATRVQAMDLRFGAPDTPAFVATALLDGGGAALTSRFTFGEARPR